MTKPQPVIDKRWEEIYKSGCSNCGSDKVESRDDSDRSSGYYDDDRPWCSTCQGWAD